MGHLSFLGMVEGVIFQFKQKWAHGGLAPGICRNGQYRSFIFLPDNSLRCTQLGLGKQSQVEFNQAWIHENEVQSWAFHKLMQCIVVLEESLSHLWDKLLCQTWRSRQCLSLHESRVCKGTSLRCRRLRPFPKSHRQHLLSVFEDDNRTCWDLYRCTVHHIGMTRGGGSLELTKT